VFSSSDTFVRFEIDFESENISYLDLYIQITCSYILYIIYMYNMHNVTKIDKKIMGKFIKFVSDTTVHHISRYLIKQKCEWCMVFKSELDSNSYQYGLQVVKT
jgi:hypothetical protein